MPSICCGPCGEEVAAAAAKSKRLGVDEQKTMAWHLVRNDRESRSFYFELHRGSASSQV